MTPPAILKLSEPCYYAKQIRMALGKHALVAVCFAERACLLVCQAGSKPGFVFTTRAQGTGYYTDTRGLPASAHVEDQRGGPGGDVDVTSSHHEADAETGDDRGEEWVGMKTVGQLNRLVFGPVHGLSANLCLACLAAAALRLEF
eukprot:scaffold233430_cov33-Prasinocladus_malaysianus.AAC.1